MRKPILAKAFLALTALAILLCSLVLHVKNSRHGAADAAKSANLIASQRAKPPTATPTNAGQFVKATNVLDIFPDADRPTISEDAAKSYFDDVPAKPVVDSPTNHGSKPISVTDSQPMSLFEDRKAKAEKGDATNQFMLGLMYKGGLGVEKDLVEAIKWLRKAAEQGYGEAQFSLGNLYYQGKEVPQDYTEAAKWYRKAAEQGDAGVQFRLGMLYDKGLGVPQDYAESAKWYRKAAEQGDVVAQFAMGFRFELGQGVETNLLEAAKWYAKAAEQGDAASQSALGFMYQFGEGVQKNFAEAFIWFRKAAEQGDAGGQLGLGSMYKLGEGLPQDYIEAYKWFNLAASHGENSYVKYRDELVRDMTPSQIAEGQRRSAEFRKKDNSETVAEPDALKATGTGFFITEDGYLLTSFHVVKDASRVAVQTETGKFTVRVVQADAANDLVVLHVVKTTVAFKALPLAASRSAKLGDPVFTIGFPNIDLQGLQPKLTKGDISSLSGIQDDPREFQISVAVQPGNSGGPLVNEAGAVIGIVEAKLSAVAALEASGSLPENVNYAVKSSYALLLLESLPDVAGKLLQAQTGEARAREAVVREAEDAVVLVLSY